MNYLFNIILREREKPGTNRKAKHSFEYQSYTLFKNGTLNNSLKTYNLNENDCNLFAWILLEFLSKIIRDLYLEKMKLYHMSLLQSVDINDSGNITNKQKLNPTLTEEQMNSRIHRIVGWSLREAILKFKKDEKICSELLEKKSGRTLKRENHIKQNQKNSRAIYT